MKLYCEKKRSIPALGTFFEVKWHHEDDLSDGNIIDVFNEVRRLEKVFSYHDVTSELSKFNRNGTTRCYELMALLKISKWLKGETFGVFNPVNLKTNDVDLGGIAKGFIVDSVVKMLESKGMSGIVNAGGDIRVFGLYVAPIYIRDPFNFKNTIYIGEFSQNSIASSCISENSKSRGGKSMVYGKSDVVHASITGKSCTICDAMTKVALTNPEIAVRILKKVGYCGMIIDKNGNKFVT
jgi:thiamine biosynthesis lipoprotein